MYKLCRSNLLIKGNNMNSLFVCHSTGDTHALIATAKALIKKNCNHKIAFLMIGDAAAKQWAALPVNSQSLSETIPVALIKKSATDSLNKEDFAVVTSAILRLIEKHKLTKALVGTPSLNRSNLAFQITEYLTQRFDNKHLFVYNDYLFKEKAHCYWKMLDENWAQEMTYLAEAPINKSVIRETLTVKDTKSLIFISGSKDLSQDKELLEALFQTLTENPKLELELRLGSHPGVVAANAPKHLFSGKDKLPSFFLTEKTFVQVMTDKLTADELIPLTSLSKLLVG